MNLLMGIMGFALTVLIIFATYRMFAFRREAMQTTIKRFKRVESLVNQFENNEEPNKEEVERLAHNVMSREMTYQLLVSQNKIDLFPRELINIKSGAESNLACWLEFPTELNAIPDAIEHVDKVEITNEDKGLYYHVFKFKKDPPHSAAKGGWMLGVVGPYSENSQPYDLTDATFSRLESKFGEISPREETEWVHQNIFLAKL